MSDSKCGSTITGTLIFAAVGAIDGWTITHTLTGVIIGIIVGVLVEAMCFVGLLPVIGVVIYHFAVNWLFGYVGFNSPLLYYLGLCTTTLITILTTYVIIK